MKKLYTILAALLLPVCALLAQNRLGGTVTDENGDPLPGASVFVQGTNNGAVTDNNGKFTINAKEGDVLVFSFIGYSDVMQTVSGTRAVYDVSLSSDQNFLDDVVVVGYGTQKKVNLTGSVSAVSSEELANRTLPSTSALLQGVASGVTVTNRSGTPGGGDTTIRVRGLGTFGQSSSEPLVLIDGVEGSLSQVDPTQIDKISILKDAASSAIYGSRAANGVILVTTKRGKAGQTSIVYRGYAGVQSPTDLPKVVGAHDYMILAREQMENDGSSSIYTDEYIANYERNHEIDPDNYPITDWQKLVLTGSGFQQNHNLAITTSTDRVRVMTSAGFLDQYGIVKYRHYNRYNLRNNMDVQLNKRLSMKLDFSVMYTKNQAIPQESTLFNYMNTRDPLALVQYSTGYHAALSGSSSNPLPFLDGDGGLNQSRGLRLNVAAGLTYKPADWLTIDVTAAPRLVQSRSHNFVGKVTYYSDALGTVSLASNRDYNQATDSFSRSLYNNYLATALFHKNFNKVHDFGLLLGASYEDYDNRQFSASRRNFPYPEFNQLTAGADDETKDNTGKAYQYALGSFFGRFTYNFRERYLLEANVRYDGSSRFLPENRWGVFPSVSAAWRVTEEPWMQSMKRTVNEFKVRASYGTLGNQSIGDYYPTEQDLAMSSISVNDVITPIATLTTLANPYITWETTTMFDVGIDAGFFGKLDITADYYRKLTDGILLQLPISATIGLNAPYQNSAKVSNVGWEVAVNWKDQIGDFRYAIGGNLSDVINKIVDMPGEKEYIAFGTGSVLRNQVGYPIASIYGYDCIGMARTQEEADYINEHCPQLGNPIKPGDLVYRDIAGDYLRDENGEFVLDANGKQIPAPDGKIDANDKTIIGSCIPRFTYGANLSIGWKGFDISAFFQGVGKVNSYVGTYYVMPGYQGGTFRQEHLDRWTPETPNGRFPRMSKSGSNNTEYSSFWMGDASYCRLKSLQVSYTLPKKVVSKIGLKGLRIFATGENVFTWTNFYQGFDPEVAFSGGDNYVTAVDIANNYPQVKTFMGGIEVKF